MVVVLCSSVVCLRRCYFAKCFLLHLCCYFAKCFLLHLCFYFAKCFLLHLCFYFAKTFFWFFTNKIALLC